MTGKYRVHRFDVIMSDPEDQRRLEEFLNGLEGEVVAIVPNIGPTLVYHAVVRFLFIIERLD